MTEQTRCPACGAPLTVVGEQDMVVCDFCSTQIRVIHDEDGERFEIYSQPEPQKEVLSQPVEPAVEDVLFGESAPEVEPEILPSGEAVTEPPSASFDAGSSNETFFAPPPPVSPPPFTGTTGGAQVFTPTSASTAPGGKSGLAGLPRWALVVIIVVVLLCLACACVAVVLALIPGITGSSY